MEGYTLNEFWNQADIQDFELKNMKATSKERI